jgi:spermidine synthase
LYDYESVTYAAVFGTFFNLKTENRVILARKDGLPPIAQVEHNAAQLKAPFARLGIDVERNVALFSTRVDWDRQTKVLTDQFSPANLLNLRE